jgi:hypothetical protein
LSVALSKYVEGMGLAKGLCERLIFEKKAVHDAER